MLFVTLDKKNIRKMEINKFDFEVQKINDTSKLNMILLIPIPCIVRVNKKI